MKSENEIDALPVVNLATIIENAGKISEELNVPESVHFMKVVLDAGMTEAKNLDLRIFEASLDELGFKIQARLLELKLIA